MARSLSALRLDIVCREMKRPLHLLARWGLRSLATLFRLSCRAIAWSRPTDRSTDTPVDWIARSGCCASRVPIYKLQAAATPMRQARSLYGRCLQGEM